jgi:MFS transporter, MCT family, solute carrier family 16 (monocarboxylic acid transporters), member 10
VLTYIDVSAVSFGISENFAFYLVAIANAASAVGRLSAGVLADKAGESRMFLTEVICT